MSGSMHLDRERLESLLAGTLVATERRALLEHLDEECERCEELLSESGSEDCDPLDGAVDEALFLAAEASREEPASTRSPRKIETARRWRRLPVAGAGLAMAATVAVFLLPKESPTRFKGIARPPQAAVSLEVLHRAPSGALSPLSDGATVSPGATLLFRLQLSDDACVQLWRATSPVEPLLDEPVCLQAGSHVLSEGEEPLGLTVEAAEALELAAVVEGNQDGVKSVLSRNEVPPGGALVRLRVASP